MRTSVRSTILAGRVGDDVFQNAAVGIRKTRPQFQFRLRFLHVRRGEHGRLEVANLSVIVKNQVAVSVADRFAAAAVGTQIADDRAHFAHRVFAAKNQHQNAPAASRLRIGRKIFEGVVVELFLDFPILRVVGGNNRFGVLPRQFRAWRKHPHRSQIEAGARDEPAQNAAGARLVKRIGGDDDVGELVRHNQLVGGLTGVASVFVSLRCDSAGTALPPKILNMTVPQVGHLPLIALRPFFIVSSMPSAISRLALHLTQ